MWLVLGSAAIITAVLNLIFWKQGKETGCYRFASISLTALTMCAFYSDSARRVSVEDWAGLMDITPAMSKALWVCVIASILINGITLFAKRSR
jgi:hypothetical protein